MNKQYFQQIFNPNIGFVYKYLGTVPEGQSAAHYITDEFVKACGNNQIGTMVVELPQFNANVLWDHTSTQQISSDKFEFITNLVADVVEETPSEEIPEENQQG